VICRSRMVTVSTTLRQQGRDGWNILNHTGSPITSVALCHRWYLISEAAIIRGMIGTAL